MNRVVEAVAEKQKALNLNESEMARKLGISRTLWYLLKAGEREPEKSFLGAVAYCFPELQLLVNQELIEIGMKKTTRDGRK